MGRLAGDLLHEDRRGGGQSGILLGEDLSRRARVVVVSITSVFVQDARINIQVASSLCSLPPN